MQTSDIWQKINLAILHFLKNTHFQPSDPLLCFNLISDEDLSVCVWSFFCSAVNVAKQTCVYCMFSSNDQCTGLSLTILKHCKTTDLHAPSTQISNDPIHRRTVMHGNTITKTHMLLTRQTNASASSHLGTFLSSKISYCNDDRLRKEYELNFVIMRIESCDIFVQYKKYVNFCNSV